MFCAPDKCPHRKEPWRIRRGTSCGPTKEHGGSRTTSHTTSLNSSRVVCVGAGRFRGPLACCVRSAAGRVHRQWPISTTAGETRWSLGTRSGALGTARHGEFLRGSPRSAPVPVGPVRMRFPGGAAAARGDGRRSALAARVAARPSAPIVPRTALGGRLDGQRRLGAMPPDECHRIMPKRHSGIAVLPSRDILWRNSISLE